MKTCSYKIFITVINNFNSGTGYILQNSGVRSYKPHTIDFHRSQMVLPQELTTQLMIHGGRILPKICEATKFTSTLENLDYLRLSLGAIYGYIKQTPWISELITNKELLCDSLIYFELFDDNENLVYSPLDLLNPITFDYESKCNWFHRESRYSFVDKHVFTDDKNQSFVIVKRQTKYTNIQEFIATSLDLYKLRIKPVKTLYTDELFDWYSLQSVYETYTEDQRSVMSETIPCAGIDRAFLTLSSINNDIPF